MKRNPRPPGSAAPPFPARPSPWRIAHRGYPAQFPENTFVGFEAALKEGVAGIELDVQLTRDGFPVVYHDRTMEMTGHGGDTIHQRNWAELRHLDVGSWFAPKFHDQRMPLLAEVLDRFGTRCVWLLEVKIREARNDRQMKLMNRVIELVKQRRLEHRTLILCYDLNILRQAHEAAPACAYVWNQDRPQFLDEADFLFAYSIRVQHLTPAFVATAHEHGKPVLTFTVNDEAQLHHALSCGADGIMSDDPRWLDQSLRVREGGHPLP